MIKKFSIIFFLALATKSISQTTVYVSPNASSSGTGTSSSPKTLANALNSNNLAPGQTVILMDGTYNVSDDQYVWQKVASAGAQITIKAQNRHKAILKGNSAKQSDYYGVLYIYGCKYITIDGLVTMHDSGSNDISAGIRIDGDSEFITIKNCLSYNNGGGGIEVLSSDHIVIESNICHSNSTRYEVNTSGISLYNMKRLTSNSDYYGCIIRGNTCYNNTCELPFRYGAESLPYPTDGNGIILDRLDDTAYGKNVLIENNVCSSNGGNGIKIFRSSLARVMNNTVYHNNKILNKYNAYNAEIYFSEIAGYGNPKVYNTGVYNNIAVADNSLTRNLAKAIVVDGDLSNAYNNHLVGLGAKFNNYSTDDVNAFPTSNVVKPISNQDYPRFNNPANGDFSLKSDSPLIDKYTQSYGPSTDVNGVSRPQGNGTDIGAFEYTGTATPPPTSTPPPSGSPTANNNCGKISNSSFESGFESWGYDSASSIGTQAQSRSGNKCAIINGTGVIYSNYISVSASKKIDFQVYARIEGSPSYAQIGIDYIASNGTTRTGKDYFDIKATSYTMYNISKFPPSGTVYAAIWVSKGGNSGKLYLDDFCMTNTSSRESSDDENTYEDSVISFKVYPNPVSNNELLKISVLDSSERAMTIQVIDFMGKQLIERNIQVANGQEYVELDLQSLATGNYIVKINQGDKQTTSKIIKE
jgi:parallel beta-helix repeat protein